jgi:outer membrane protein TolC
LLQGTTRFIRDESARPITLEEALTLSDRLNLNLKIAQTDQRRDRWRFYNSLAQFVPDVTPLFYERRRIDGTFFVGGAFPVDVDITTHTVGATFRAQVFNGFRNVLESATRQSTLQASRADVRRTQADVLLDTYTLYQQLLLAKAEVAIAEDAVAQARSTLGLNQARFQAGTAPRLDVLQSEAELAQEVQRLLAAQNNYRTQSATLSEVLGIPILTDLVPVETTVLPKTLLDDTVSLQDLTALALANRPEIQRERYRVQANRINQWSAFSDVLPDVIFSNTSQAQGQTLDYMPNSQIRQFQLNWNLPQSGASAVTQFQVLRAETERARLVQQQTERQVTREVNERYFTAQSQKSQIEAFRLRLRSTDEAFRLSRLRLEAGLITTTDLLINQVNRNRAQLDLARTILDYNISQARLIHGIGLMSKQTLLTSTPLCPTPPPTGRPAPKAPPLPTQNPVTPAPLPPQP